MLILERKTDRDRVRWVLVFGLGMIGREVRAALERMGYVPLRELGFSWTDPARQAEDGDRILEWMRSSPRSPTALSVVWSAGRTGFLADESELQAEQDAFSSVLRLFGQCSELAPQASRAFHYLSSAGGLYEGQRLVDLSSRPDPIRPYGSNKLDQERRLERLSDRSAVFIYRPSSVYGLQRRIDDRKGLINNLIACAATGRCCRLDARVMALRDYVYAGDVGRFIAEKVATAPAMTDSRIHHLASGRSRSILEVKRSIERLMTRPVLYCLDKGFGNSSDMSYHPSLLPEGWQPRGLDAGIRQLLAHTPGRLLRASL